MLKFVTARTGILLFRESLGVWSGSENQILTSVACRIVDAAEARCVDPESLNAWKCEISWLDNAISWLQDDRIDGRSERGMCSRKVYI